MPLARRCSTAERPVSTTMLARTKSIAPGWPATRRRAVSSPRTKKEAARSRHVRRIVSSCGSVRRRRISGWAFPSAMLGASASVRSSVDPALRPPSTRRSLGCRSRVVHPDALYFRSRVPRYFSSPGLAGPAAWPADVVSQPRARAPFMGGSRSGLKRRGRPGTTRPGG